jgi:hypothetical protein
MTATFFRIFAAQMRPSAPPTENIHGNPYAHMTDEQLAPELAKLGIAPAEPMLRYEPTTQELNLSPVDSASLTCFGC